MTQLLRATPITSDEAHQMIDLLERHRRDYPFIEEDLARHHTLLAALADQSQRSEHALAMWRTALAQRWSCEVAAQRVYSAVQRQLSAFYGADPAYSQLIAPAQPSTVSTPVSLLHEVRRLEAALELMTPHPLFAGEGRDRLRAAADGLAAAINLTDRCEAERRSVLAQQRVASSLLAQAHERARRRLAHYVQSAE